MKTSTIAFYICLLLFGIAFLFIANTIASPLDSITINNADNIRNELVIESATLNSYITMVANRITVQYANNIRPIIIIAVPDSLSIQLSEVVSRLVYQYANSNRLLTLSYPMELIDDSTPPALLADPEASFGATMATVTWTTDEFTTYVFRYGSTSGVYTEELSTTQFKKTHQAVMTGLSAAETYFYQITLTDLSGNQTTSQEYELTGDYYVYLPMIIR